MPPDADDLRRSSAHVIVGGEILDGDRIDPDDDVEHHLRRVLRVREGDRISVTDGEGRWRIARVGGSGATVVLEAETDVVSEPRPDPFTLATAIPKGDRLDWLVQKATELGVDRLVLIDAERSVVRWRPDRAAKQLGRLRRIADEATRQSRRVWRTTVEGPVPALAVLPGASAAEPGGAPVVGDEAVIAVGPEGGWSAREISAASSCVGLSVHILRVETAAVAAITLRMVERH